MLLKQNLTHDVDSVTTLKTLSSAYPPPSVLAGKLLHISRPQLMSHRTSCTSGVKSECNCHVPAPGRNCITHRQALQYFPDTSQVSHYRNNKINLPVLQEVLKVMSL
jgi:hypothetical protein